MPLRNQFPIFSGLPYQGCIEDAERLALNLEQSRQHEAAGTIRALLSLQAITQGLLNEAKTQACRSAAIASDLSISVDAIECTRRTLEEHGVPPATWIDDAAMNAVVQRNRIALVAENMMAIINQIGPDSSVLGGVPLNEFLANIRARLIENGYDYPQAEASRSEREEDQATV